MESLTANEVADLAFQQLRNMCVKKGQEHNFVEVIKKFSASYNY
ncbi:MAG: hypothetical protein ACOC32_04215 [Nanoarchaeota archaeon]